MGAYCASSAKGSRTSIAQLSLLCLLCLLYFLPPAVPAVPAAPGAEIEVMKRPDGSDWELGSGEAPVAVRLTVGSRLRTWI